MTSIRTQVQRDFIQELAHRMCDKKTADFTIVCCGEEFKVHKAILSSHSKYFDRLFKSGYQESRENRIDLVDDLKAAVKCMIQYFYKFDYSFELGDVSHDLDFEHFEWTANGRVPALFTFSEPMLPSDALLPSTLHGDACMYALADKYEIPGLKRTALSKYEMMAKRILKWCKQEGDSMRSFANPFLNTIPYIYTHTPPNDVGLRVCVADVWANSSDTCAHILGKQAMGAFLGRHQDFAVDLVTYMGFSHASNEKCDPEVQPAEEEQDEEDDEEDS